MLLLLLVLLLLLLPRATSTHTRHKQGLKEAAEVEDAAIGVDFAFLFKKCCDFLYFYMLCLPFLYFPYMFV